MLPENRSFLIRGDDGHEYGPVDLAELREWVAENRAGLGTEVRHDDPGAAWHPWQSYPELVALLAEVRVTSPVSGQPGLVIAPLGRRTIAFAVDLILAGFLSSPITIVLTLIYMPDWYIHFTVALEHILMGQTGYSLPTQLPPYGELITRFLPNAVLACYMAGFHMAHGRTPGKSFQRIRVVNELGEKPSPMNCFIRALVLILSMGLCFIPLAYVFFNPERRAFHDFIAGTYVVEA